MEDKYKEATRGSYEVKPIVKHINSNQKTAREMFEALGYEEVEVDSDDPSQYIRFTKSGGPVDINIDFDVKYKQISAYEFDWYYPEVHAYAVNMQELQAINQMVKELRWDQDEK